MPPLQPGEVAGETVAVVGYDRHMSSTAVPGLAVTRLAAGEITSLDLVMLHGIYGRGRNWQAVARAVVAARPDVACWLVDLPHHGASGPGRHGDTVHGLAQDVLDWAGVAGVKPRVVLGHSYGGKVALAMAARLPRDTPPSVGHRLHAGREDAVGQRLGHAASSAEPAGPLPFTGSRTDRFAGAGLRAAGGAMDDHEPRA